MKLLIIRFSSFGDIIQGLGVPALFQKTYPGAEIHWLVRSDFADLLRAQKSIQNVWSFEREKGVMGLLRLARQLKKENFTHVYDAHNNLRSHLISSFFYRAKFIRRPKNRLKRLLFFRFKMNVFPKPFIAQKSYIDPIRPWLKTQELPPPLKLEVSEQVRERLAKSLAGFTPFTVLAPVTAWKKKNWPLGHWKKLIESLPDQNFVILGGPKDLECQELAQVARPGSGKTLNLAGQTSLLESCLVLTKSQGLISADTGLLHAADQMGVPVLALIGPTAFGYPARPTSRVLEIKLACKPCTKDGRGPCTNTIFQKCMVDIRPEDVQKAMREDLRA